MNKSIQMDSLQLGVCYYPEHWDEVLWQDDLHRMKEIGIHTVRVFEFAWSIVEPIEGQYDFSLFDRFLSLASKENMQVIMCTPTATPPAWLTHAHPECLNQTKDGLPMHHGHRRHYTYNSAVYNAYVQNIVTKLAERYGQHPAVIGWQIDNEINCEVNEFYADADHDAFRVYLQERYQTLDALNHAIGGRFWNQSYASWDAVYLERHTATEQGNPHMSLLAKEFFSISAIRFAKLQSDILRRYIGNRFITTNGVFGHLDNHQFTQSALDFMMYDSYPNFAYMPKASDDGLKDRKWSMNLSRVRALSANFGIMEQQAGANGWDFTMMAPMPLPGQMRLWTMQSVSHGADFVSYFRWRTAPYGTEIYWHGLNDYDNRPNRRLAEVAQIHQDLCKLQDVAGSTYQAKVAILTDTLNEWDGERDQWHGPMNKQSTLAIFSAAQHTHTPLDMLNLNAVDDAILAQYTVIFYPHPAILSDDTVQMLKAYCEQGGTVVMGARTGYKNTDGHCPMRTMPGAASTLCDVTVQEYSFPHPLQHKTLAWNDTQFDAVGFQETLQPMDLAKPFLYYNDHTVAGTYKKYPNQGGAYYLGCGFTEAWTTQLLTTFGLAQPYGQVLVCPWDVELCVRQNDQNRFFFLLNYSDKEQTIILPHKMYHLLADQKIQDKLTLKPFDVAVLTDLS